jgi:hypothetical protein
LRKALAFSCQEMILAQLFEPDDGDAGLFDGGNRGLEAGLFDKGAAGEHGADPSR